jgi:O-antigen ligase
VWWKEAAGAFSARPIGGWGAGSFPVVHLLYRRNTLPVQQPHSVPLQFLAETGVVGTMLALAAFALLLTAATATVRRLPGGRERLLAGALLGASLAYALHSFYDWDWNIPAVTLPALVFIGVLAGSHERRRPALVAVETPNLLGRAIWLGALVLWLCAFALSAALPSLAASKASSAVIEAADVSPGALRAAQSDAELASRLDPLSDAGLTAEATIAVHRGELARARSYLRQAVARNPSDGLAWTELAGVDLNSGHRAEAIVAAQRVVALDPEGATARSVLRSVLLEVAPAASPTATRTPLPTK